MNPVLLKPGGARRSHLVLRGRPTDRRQREELPGPAPAVAGCHARLEDRVESRAGTVEGLGLLPVRVHFDTDKHVGRTTGTAYGEPVTTGYEIHHGVAALTVPGAAQPFLDGYRLGAVWGTTWRGAWKSDGFRRAFLRDVADLAGRDFAPAPDVELAAVRAEHLDPLGDLVADHLDIAVTVCVRSWLTRNSRHALRPAFRAPWCPGCCSAIAVPRLAGVPVTSRGIAHEFTVASGHLRSPGSWSSTAGRRTPRSSSCRARAPTDNAGSPAGSTGWPH